MIDSSELRAFAAELTAAQAAAGKETRAVVQKGALNIKQEWQKRWSGLGSAPSLAAAVTYDTKIGASEMSAEIGPDKNKRQGPLGNLIEFGSVKNGPIPGGMPALEAEQPRFLKALGDLGARLLER